MAIRLVALDLDGTALKGHRVFTERTRQAVLAALAAGILVVPATGRSYVDIPEEIRTLPGIPCFLTSNGANIVDGAGNSLCTDLIPWVWCVKVLRLLEEYDMGIPTISSGAAWKVWWITWKNRKQMWKKFLRSYLSRRGKQS